MANHIQDTKYPDIAKALSSCGKTSAREYGCTTFYAGDSIDGIFRATLHRDGPLQRQPAKPCVSSREPFSSLLPPWPSAFRYHAYQAPPNGLHELLCVSCDEPHGQLLPLCVFSPAQVLLRPYGQPVPPQE